MPSAAAQVIVTVIPIVGIVMGSVLIFFFFLWNYKQKKLMIEKGIYQKNVYDIDAFSLFAGLILICIGLSLVLFYLIKEGFSYELLGGLIPLSIGIALILFFMIRKKLKKNE